MSKMLPFFNGRILTFIQNIQIMITWIPVVNFFWEQEQFNITNGSPKTLFT